MLEIPEGCTLKRQFVQTLQGKRVKSVMAGTSPHKFAGFLATTYGRID